MADPFSVESGDNDNWISFSFNSTVGYERIGATAHGTPEFVAEKFGIKDFDGKISTLMKSAIAIDKYFKAQYTKENSGKA